MSRPPPGRRIALAGLLCLSLSMMGVSQGPAEDATDISARLTEAEAALSDAEAALSTADEGEERLVALGLAVRAQEQALTAYREALRLLSRRARALDIEIAAGGERLSALLAVLQSLSTAPRSALFAYPGGPLRAARAQMMLASVTPALEQQRITLATQLDQLRALRDNQQAAQGGAELALGGLQRLRAETAIAIDERRRSLPPQRLMERQADKARAGAETVGALAEALDELLAASPGAAAPSDLPFAEAQHRLSLPVPGSVSGEFGAADPWGNPGAGLVIDAPAYASVTAPMPATVRFAGELSGYGTVVILEPEPGWLVTLAGLGRADREIGEQVAAGETLGVMDQNLSDPSEILLAQGDDRDLIEARSLYLEIRRDGVPVDPAPWFAGSD
ncbi:MAG: peptidoglycan DD-metalloendopeptidase family protein [Pseudomonadota bacterium]